MFNIHLIPSNISKTPSSFFALACHFCNKENYIFSYEHYVTGNSINQYMLHFIYVALPFLFFAIYRGLTNVETFFQTNPSAQECHIQCQESLIICLTTSCANNSTTLSSSVLLSFSVPMFHHSFVLFDHFISSQHVHCHRPLLRFSIFFMFCRLSTCASSCSPFHQHYY